jgi:hypothetical protein
MNDDTAVSEDAAGWSVSRTATTVASGTHRAESARQATPAFLLRRSKLTPLR